MANKCAHCGGPATNACSGCLNVAYCSASHQEEHWPVHRYFCAIEHDSLKCGGHISYQKARKILHDGEVRGHPITDKQRRYFGAVVSHHKRGTALRVDGRVGRFGHFAPRPYPYVYPTYPPYPVYIGPAVAATGLAYYAAQMEAAANEEEAAKWYHLYQAEKAKQRARARRDVDADNDDD